MFPPEYIQLQNVALLLQKCVNISSGYLKVSQVKCYNFHIYLTPPPPHTHTHIFQTANMFFYVLQDVLETFGWLAKHHTKLRTVP